MSDQSSEDSWRRLALQFDAHRIEAMSMLKGVVAGTVGAEECGEFLNKPPPSKIGAIEALVDEVKTLRKKKLEVVLHTSKAPPVWEVGMRVRYTRTQEWGPSKGDEGTVSRLDGTGRPGHEYQVFWVEPDRYGGTFWTTPSDVEWLPDTSREEKSQLVEELREITEDNSQYRDVAGLCGKAADLIEKLICSNLRESVSHV